jgi:hypothetical protein
MARAMNAGLRSEPVKATKPITPEEIASSTWEKMPTVPDVQISLEVKPLFVLTGGNRAT